MDSGEEPKAAALTAWKEAYNKLWGEYNCCYYYCKEFDFSAFTGDVSKEDLQRIYHLSKIVSAQKDAQKHQQQLEEIPDYIRYTTKEEFDAAW